MHELSVTQSILDISLSEAKKYNAKKINEIRISIGVMAGMVPECIQEYFNLISEGTVAHNAKLTFKKIPVTFVCSECGEKYSADKIRLRCDKCGTNRVKILSGKEFFVESIDIED